MPAPALFHKWLSEVLPKMHRKRLEAVAALTSAAVRGGRLTVTWLGRSIISDAKEKHNIKRADRLLSNARFTAAHLDVYRALSRKILGDAQRPVILIDWATIDERQKFYLLRAATPVQGRSMTLYEEIHTLSTKEKPLTHSKFLKNLAEVIPPDLHPIVITDAGFRVPWFKEVLARGWDFIGRVRNRDMVRFPSENWIHGKELYRQATRIARTFRQVELCRSNSLTCSFALFKGKAKGRKAKTKTGEYTRSRRSLRSASRSREPWLLATSLEQEEATKIVKLYATRMQIEEAFRDLKNARCGFALEYTRTYHLSRMKNLVLIGTLATTLSWLLGVAAVINKRHREFQANTATGPVLSAAFLGIQIFKKIEALPHGSLSRAIEHVQSTVRLNAL